MEIMHLAIESVPFSESEKALFLKKAGFASNGKYEAFVYEGLNDRVDVRSIQNELGEFNRWSDLKAAAFRTAAFHGLKAHVVHGKCRDQVALVLTSTDNDLDHAIELLWGSELAVRSRLTDGQTEWVVETTLSSRASAMATDVAYATGKQVSDCKAIAEDIFKQAIRQMS
jgi:hypothetical protein